MAPHVPGFPAERMAPLPPGCQVVDGAEPRRSSSDLHQQGAAGSNPASPTIEAAR